MPTRHLRIGALFLGLALAVTASPALASTEQVAESKVATPPGQAAQPTQQQAAPKLLRIVNISQQGSASPIRPGDLTSFAVTVQNNGQQREEFVLTFTPPPELTRLGNLRSPDADFADCRENVCRGFVEPGGTRTVVGEFRLSPSFRGNTTTIRADLQEDANPTPGERTRTLTVPVQQPSGGQPAGSAPSSGTSTGTGGAGSTANGLTELPRTGERTTFTALVALCLLLLGVMAQRVGTRRRPVTYGG